MSDFNLFSIVSTFPDLFEELYHKAYPFAADPHTVVELLDFATPLRKAEAQLRRSDSLAGSFPLSAPFCFSQETVMADVLNNHFIEQASDSWEACKANKGRYRMLRRQMVAFIADKTLRVHSSSSCPGRVAYESKTDAEVRAWIQEYIALIKEYKAFLVTMVNMAVTRNVVGNDDL
jgi:hypothetical protein